MWLLCLPNNRLCCISRSCFFCYPTFHHVIVSAISLFFIYTPFFLRWIIYSCSGNLELMWSIYSFIIFVICILLPAHLANRNSYERGFDWTGERWRIKVRDLWGGIKSSRCSWTSFYTEKWNDFLSMGKFWLFFVDLSLWTSTLHSFDHFIPLKPCRHRHGWQSFNYIYVLLCKDCTRLR